MKYSIIALLILLLPFAACKKETSKTNRDKVIGIWQDRSNNIFEFDKDGTGIQRLAGSSKSDFTWALNGTIELDVVYPDGRQETWTIFRLTDDQLYLRIGYMPYYFDKKP